MADPEIDLSDLSSLIEKKRESVIQQRKKLKEENAPEKVVRVERVRLCENYETVMLEKNQMQGLRQMERFAKRIQLLQKLVSEKAIELTQAQKARGDMQTQVFVLQERNAATSDILNQLVAIHAKLRPQGSVALFVNLTG